MGCPGGAGLQASSCVFQAHGNGVGKDTAPYGANERQEDFQPLLSLWELAPSMDQAALGLGSSLETPGPLLSQAGP